VNALAGAPAYSQGRILEIAAAGARGRRGARARLPVGCGLGPADGAREHLDATVEIAQVQRRLSGSAVAIAIADLVGHIVLEAQGPIEASEMQGLVLVDELDLYLHPVWQVGLVSALRSIGI